MTKIEPRIELSNTLNDFSQKALPCIQNIQCIHGIAIELKQKRPRLAFTLLQFVSVNDTALHNEVEHLFVVTQDRDIF